MPTTLNGRRYSAARGVDWMAKRGALAFRQAIGTRKGCARKLGRSTDTVDRYANGDKSSPVFRFCELLRAVERPSFLIAHARTVAMQVTFDGSDPEMMVARFWELMREEAEAEGAENGESQGFALTGDLDALAEAHEREAALQVEIVAVARWLRERNIDPRTWRQP